MPVVHKHDFQYLRLTTPSSHEDCFLIYYCNADGCDAYDLDLLTAIDISQYEVKNEAAVPWHNLKSTTRCQLSYFWTIMRTLSVVNPCPISNAKPVPLNPLKLRNQMITQPFKVIKSPFVNPNRLSLMRWWILWILGSTVVIDIFNSYPPKEGKWQCSQCEEEESRDELRHRMSNP